MAEHNIGRLREQMLLCQARALALRDVAEGLRREEPADPVAYIETVASAHEQASDLLIELITERAPAVQP